MTSCRSGSFVSLNVLSCASQALSLTNECDHVEGDHPVTRIFVASGPTLEDWADRGAPDTIRTCDLCLRRATLYPAELRVLAGFI